MLFRKSNKAKAAKKGAVEMPAPGAAPAAASSKSRLRKATPLYRKPTADLFTVMLVLSFIAVVVGIVFLWMEMNLYKYEFKGGPSVGMIEARPTTLICSHHAAVPPAFFA